MVTGATGFIGSHLCTALIECGYAVTAAVRRTSDRRWLDGVAVDYAEIDLFTGAGLGDALDGMGVVFHLAGLTRGHGHREYHRGNELITRNLLEAARNAGAASSRFVYLSSLAAAGPPAPNREAVETDPPCPP